MPNYFVASLDYDLLSKIFIESQNTHFVKVCKKFNEVSRDPISRANFIQKKFDKSQSNSIFDFLKKYKNIIRDEEMNYG
ncbi:hypothetical protein AYI69_g9562 [Smittium culicis]|uniref:F-box domain-containing protein n=1 Tax=Smittium culicis TaxID=133412 RepID=A0A1R1XBY5_9FUNG|nr:hypothetical protein AYI69_g9562 [Smittium culicis]